MNTDALMLAMTKRPTNWDIVMSLLNSGLYDSEAVNKYVEFSGIPKINLQGKYPLFFMACEVLTNAPVEVLQKFIELGANVNLTSEPHKLSSLIIAKGTDWKYNEFLNKEKVIKNQIEKMKLLLKHGVDINQANDYGNTVTMIIKQQMEHSADSYLMQPIKDFLVANGGK